MGYGSMVNHSPLINGSIYTGNRATFLKYLKKISNVIYLKVVNIFLDIKYKITFPTKKKLPIPLEFTG